MYNWQSFVYSILLHGISYYVFGKKNKARMQLNLVNEVPTTSRCMGCPQPTTAGYQEIVALFTSYSEVLNGDGNFNDFKDF